MKNVSQLYIACAKVPCQNTVWWYSSGFHEVLHPYHADYCFTACCSWQVYHSSPHLLSSSDQIVLWKSSSLRQRLKKCGMLFLQHNKNIKDKCMSLSRPALAPCLSSVCQLSEKQQQQKDCMWIAHNWRRVFPVMPAAWLKGWRCWMLVCPLLWSKLRYLNNYQINCLNL